MKKQNLKTGLLILVAVSTGFIAQAKEPRPSDASSVEASLTAVAEQGVPGGLIIEEYNLHAKVIAIDSGARKVTLKGPLGGMLTVTAGPEAVNFEQLKRGDYINASVVRTLEVFLGDELAALNDGESGLAVLAPVGAQPGGMIADSMQMTAKVTAIDQVQRTATLAFADGSSGIVNVRPDIDLETAKVGQNVVIRATEIVYIAVE